MDLTGAYLSNERECLELGTDRQTYIVKPKQLSFHSINKDPDWMYFRLDTHHLQPSGVYDYGEDEEKEEVTEIASGAYFNRGVWDHGYFDYDDGKGEVRLKSNARVVTRFFRGSIVIFCKFSHYNLVQGPTFNAYDATHNKYDNADFRKLISGMSDITSKTTL
jgi:serine/threonine-protein kinase